MEGLYVAGGLCVVLIILIVVRKCGEYLQGGAGLDPEDYSQRDKDSYP